MPRGLALGLLSSVIATTAPPAAAFPHVVQRGETLADLAESFYGRVEHEQILVAANALDAGRGTPVVAGMRLEIPAVSYYRVQPDDTWPALAKRLLGDAERADVLAQANDVMPWLAPPAGLRLIVPYNLTYVAQPGDTTLTIAYRFLGERDKAWTLDRYNGLGGDPVRPGDVLLVPLVDLKLTERGRLEAASAGNLVRTEAGGDDYDSQRDVELKLPKLVQDVRGGRFIAAIALGNQMLGTQALSQPQVARIQRELVEAYVAMDELGHAATSCSAWRDADPRTELDPVFTSPKIIDACTQAGAIRPRETKLEVAPSPDEDEAFVDSDEAPDAP